MALGQHRPVRRCRTATVSPARPWPSAAAPSSATPAASCRQRRTAGSTWAPTSVFTRSNSVRTASSSRYCSRPSISQTVGVCGSKPASVSAVGQSSARSTPIATRRHRGSIIGKQVVFGGDHRGLVQFVDGCAVGPGQPVCPRVHAGGEDDDLMGHAHRPQQGIVEEPGAHDDLNHRPLPGLGDRRGQQRSPGVAGEFVRVRVGEEPVVAGGLHGADRRHQEPGARHRLSCPVHALNDLRPSAHWGTVRPPNRT